jgi:hypothetical protein
LTLSEFNRDYLPIIQLGISILGLTSLVMVFIQIGLTRKWNKISSFYTLYDYNKSTQLEKSMHNSLDKINVDIKAVKDTLSAEIVEKIYTTDDIYFEVKTFLDDLEYFCTAIQVGAIDNSLAYSIHSPRVTISYEIFKDFITKMRKLKNDDEIYYELEKTTLEWNAKALKISRKRAKIIKKSLISVDKTKGVPKEY